PISIGAGDLNGDGRLDLLTANSLSGTISVMYNTAGQRYLGVEPPPRGLPPLFDVRPVRPNPARGASEVHFTLPSARRVRVDVFDLAGRLVRALRPGGELPAGGHPRVLGGRGGARRPGRDGGYTFPGAAGGGRAPHKE